MKVNIDFGNDGISLEANIGVDGDQYYALLGDDLQSGICGFGDTPREAIEDFKGEFRNINAKIGVAKNPDIFSGTLKELGNLSIRNK